MSGLVLMINKKSNYENIFDFTITYEPARPIKPANILLTIIE